MELKQIQCFLAVAEELSFTAAAEKMYLSQPSLSRHIQNLEMELGVFLFKRGTKSVRLTDAGLRLLPMAKELSAVSGDIQAAAGAFRTGRAGKLKIGFQGSARCVVPDILRSFTDRYTGVDISIEEYGAEELMDKLIKSELDIVFAFSVIRDGIEEYSSLIHETLYTDDIYMFVGNEKYSEYRALGREAVLSDFDRETLIQISREVNPAYFDFLRSIYMEHGFYPRRIKEPTLLNTLMLLVESGLGVSLLPRKATSVYYKGTKCLRLKDVRESLDIEAIWDPDNPNPSLTLMKNVIHDNITASGM